MSSEKLSKQFVQTKVGPETAFRVGKDYAQVCSKNSFPTNRVIVTVVVESRLCLAETPDDEVVDAFVAGFDSFFEDIRRRKEMNELMEDLAKMLAGSEAKVSVEMVSH